MTARPAHPARARTRTGTSRPGAARPQGGQATVEFVALSLLCCLIFGALFALKEGFDGRSYGGFLARHVVCAVSGRCAADERRLAAVYGERDAATVRALAPHIVYEPGERQLPVDWRRCRRPRCAEAPDDPALDAHRAGGGRAAGRAGGGGRAAGRAVDGGRATAFTHVVRRHGRLYVQYWLYYPDSNSVLAGADRLWERSWLLPRLRGLIDGTSDYPGFHRDDWEGVFVRVDPDGTTWMRASSHGHVQSCKWLACHEHWARSTGWVRVSRGSHAGHVPFRSERRWRDGVQLAGPRYLPLPDRPRRTPLLPGRDFDERTSTGEGLRLVPLEGVDRKRYRPLDPEVRPPWRKEAWSDPESDRS
jgi:hypothetical protein